MLKPLFDLLSAAWEILLRVPMPWRAGIVVLVVFTIGYWLIWRAGPWLLANFAKLSLLLVRGLVSSLLLIEYAINRPRRQRGVSPIAGTFAFDSVIETIGGSTEVGVKKLNGLVSKRKPPRKIWMFWAFLFAVVPILLWYSRPNFAGTKFGSYIDNSLAWWNSLEGWALTGNWTSAAFAAPSVSKQETKPQVPSSELQPSQSQPIASVANVEIRSIPEGASVTLNDNFIGSAPISYAARPNEKLKIKLEAEGFDPIEIEKEAPKAGGMIIIEYPLMPSNFSYGSWLAHVEEQLADLELQKGGVASVRGMLIFKESESNPISLQGRYDPVQRTLTLSDANSEGRIKVMLSEDLKNMSGEWRTPAGDSTLTFIAEWQSNEKTVQ